MIKKIIKNNGVRYRLLDYIQSTGTQYFYSGITASFNFKMELDIDIFETGGQCGCDDLLIGLNAIEGTNGRYIARIGKNGTVLSKDAVLGRHTIVLDAPNNSFTIDGDTSAVSRGSNPGSTNMTILARRGTGGDSFQVKGKLYGCKIWESNVMKRNYIPVERVSDNAIGLLDLISGTLHTNAGTGTFGKGHQKVEHIYKPKYKAKTYEILDSITSNGGQYIKLGVSGNGLAEWDVKFKANNRVGSSWSVLFGHRPSGSSTDDLEICAYNLSSRSSFNQIAHSIDSRVTTGDVGTTTIWRCIKQGNKLSIKDYTEEPSFDGTFNQNPSLTFTLEDYLFAMNVNNSVAYNCIATFYYLKYYANGVLDRDLIPVKRLSDNAIGVYDRVRKQFYGNAGTGAFTGQSLATPEFIEEDVEQVDYIQSSGTQYIDTGLKTVANTNTITRIDTDFGVTKSGTELSPYGANKSGYKGGGLTVRLVNGQTSNNYFYYRDWQAFTANIELNTLYHSTHYIEGNYCYYKLLKGSTTVVNVNRNYSTSEALAGNLPYYVFATSNTAYPEPQRLSNGLAIYGMKFYEGNTLVRDYIPVKYGSEYCLLDKVNMKLHHNNGTGSFTGGTRVEVAKMQQIYLKNNTKYYALDYIKTDGNSVIDTGITVKKNISKLEMDINITTSDNNHQVGCGGNDADVIFFTRGYVYLLNVSQGGTAFTIPINERKKYIADAVNNKMGYEGNLINLTPTANQSKDTFTIGARKNGGVYQLGGSDIIYDFKAYENNNLVCHLVPVERTDGVIGMLDLVNGNFKTNASGGSFTKGNYIEKLLP